MALPITAHDEDGKDPRLRRFASAKSIEAIRDFTPADSFNTEAFLFEARIAAGTYRHGGHVTQGSHGEYQGIDMHWQLWGMVDGGLTPLEALRSATLMGAQGMGVEQDIGSLEVGKLADLLVLDKNPLEDIHNTFAIHYVMKNGELYDGETMAGLWPTPRPAPIQRPE